MSGRRFLAVVLGWSLLGCAERKTAERPDATLVPDSTRGPADSLALRTSTGVEVWFVASRPATDSLGRGCTERVMEIRRDGKRIAIPLLYTGAVPDLVNDSTIRARIWLHCRPGNTYEVNLRNGNPLRVER